MGDPFGAAHAMEEARLLDGQDRFLNQKTAKYLMRTGEVERANQLLGLFTKVRNFIDREPSTSLRHLFEHYMPNYI